MCQGYTNYQIVGRMTTFGFPNSMHEKLFVENQSLSTFQGPFENLPNQHLQKPIFEMIFDFLPTISFVFGYELEQLSHGFRLKIRFCLAPNFGYHCNWVNEFKSELKLANKYEPRSLMSFR